MDKDQQKCLNTIKELLKLYHEYHLMKYHEIIDGINKYLHKYRFHDGFAVMCIGNYKQDTSDITDVGDDFYIIPIDVLLGFCDGDFISNKDDILDAIQWYLKEYQPDYQLLQGNINDPGNIIDNIDSDFRIICTSVACPEQYTVIHKATGFECGYIRLRFGNLRCDYPNCDGTTIYSHTFSDDMKGCFDNDIETVTYLTYCIKAIKETIIKYGIMGSKSTVTLSHFDWNETNKESESYIAPKPVIPKM